MNAIVLTTEANFDYKPTEEEIITYVADNEEKNPKDYIRNPSPLEMRDLVEKYTAAEEEMIGKQESKSFVKKKVNGDL